MTRILLAGAVLIGVALVSCEWTAKDGAPQVVSDTGTIVFIGLEGGFYGIIDDHSRHWDPSNLPQDFKVDSLRVRFDAILTYRPNFHMWGKTVDLRGIEKLKSTNAAAERRM